MPDHPRFFYDLRSPDAWLAAERLERATAEAAQAGVLDVPAVVVDGHAFHGDGRVALWLAAPEGAQAGLVAAAPEHYFVPPYVGHRGWVGVRLVRGLEWDAVAGAIEEAYSHVAPKRLVEGLRDGAE